MTLPTPAPADGEFVLVPREPTREMWAASGNAVNRFGHRLKSHHDKYSEAVWTAMIAARPTPPVAGEVAEALADYHEDRGDVLWWSFPITEAPYVGSPLSSDWPGYHTHFTPLPPPPALDSPVSRNGEDG